MTHAARLGRTRSVSLGLIVSFLGSWLPVGLQASNLSAGSSARSQARADANWSRVLKLPPDTDIIITVKGSPPAQRYVVSADDFGLTVLNVADPLVPAAARDVLRGVALRHADYFLSVQRGGQFVLEKQVRIGPDGVFVVDRKVADFGQVVEKIARTDAAEIAVRKKGRGVWGHLGPLGGYFVGGMSGGILATVACQAARGRDRCDTGAFLLGMLVGGIAGGVHGFRAAIRETVVVIYRAP